MPIPHQKSGITFEVHQVQKAAKALPITKTYLALKKLVGSDVEACCDYSKDCLARVGSHPLILAAHLAFSEHRPFLLSPDMIWVTIVQGVAQHVKNHGERLRPLFVGHAGQLRIQIDRNDLHKGSPENLWDEVIHELSLGIRGHLGEQYDRLIADFSTTGPLERVACEVALLDMFSPYFEYVVMCVCGIPSVTLEGTAEDWKRLRAKVEHLAPYDLEWWLPCVRNICDQFVRASNGDIDLRHWKDLYKRQEAYGFDNINGWLVSLIPYLKNDRTGNFTVRNPVLEDCTTQITSDSLPTGVSLVPFRCGWFGRDELQAMEFLGGFVGITQDVETLALRPKLGWGVRRAAEQNQWLSKISDYSPSPPLDAPEFDACLAKFLEHWRDQIPNLMINFYKKCNGFDLANPFKTTTVRFRRLEEVEMLDGLRGKGIYKGVHVSTFLRFCDLADGTSLAIETAEQESICYERDSDGKSVLQDRTGWKVVRTASSSAIEPSDPIVAWSFEEVLQRTFQGETWVSAPALSESPPLRES